MIATCEREAGEELAKPETFQLGEAELIERIRSGECRFFHDLVQPYERGLYATVNSVVRNGADAEEVVQDALLKAFQHLETLREDERFKGWLFRIAANEAQMRRRKYRRHLYETIEGCEEEQRGAKQFADWRDLPSELAEYAELRAVVLDAIESLPDDYREIYLLSDTQDLSMEELAGALGISISSAKTRLHRARTMLQKRLEPRFVHRWKDRCVQMLRGMNPWSAAGK